LAAKIEEKTGKVAQLVRGDGGIFDVSIEGVLRFSKHEMGRYPEDHEILSLILEYSAPVGAE